MMTTIIHHEPTVRTPPACSAKSNNVAKARRRRAYRFITLTVIVMSAAIAFTACRRGASTNDETPDNSTYRPLPTPATEFEQKLKLARDAHFQIVLVFTRLDGKEFTSEDREILHANAPKVVDWIGMDDKKKFFAGSNFPIEQKNLAVLLKRYKIEDYSGK